MTAEIAVVNANGVALAADSAATIHDTKVYNSANKLFTLSKYEPVAIMIYGSSSLLGVPWEVLIKEFRTQLYRDHHGTLAEYVESFWEYIHSRNDIFTRDVQLPAIEERLRDIFMQIEEKDIQDMVRDLLGKGRSSSDFWKEFRQKFDELIAEYQESVSNLDILDGFEDILADDIIKAYTKSFNACSENLNAIKDGLANEQVVSLYRIAAESIRRNFDMSSGIVFAGYGRSEILPRISSYVVGIFVNNELQRQPIPGLSNIKDSPFYPNIYPFAQNEMVISFVHGVSQLTQQRLQEAFSQISDEWYRGIYEKLSVSGLSIPRDLAKVLEGAFKEKREEMVSTLELCKQDNMNPIMQMLGHLQKDELAEMAESLVNLTVFKRKISREMESVGGPIDVAVISKGDGFIWVKRKHYFKPELNRAFFNNYFDSRGVNHEQEG